MTGPSVAGIVTLSTRSDCGGVLGIAGGDGVTIGCSERADFLLIMRAAWVEPPAPRLQLLWCLLGFPLQPAICLFNGDNLFFLFRQP